MSDQSSTRPTLINPAGLYDPSAHGYSQVGVVHTPARFIYVAGQGGENAQGEHSPDFKTQVEQAIKNLQTGLAAADADMSDVVKLTVYIVDHSMERLQIYTTAIKETLNGRMAPACTLVPVPKLALDTMLFEIEAVAVTPA